MLGLILLFKYIFVFICNYANFPRMTTCSFINNNKMYCFMPFIEYLKKITKIVKKKLAYQ